jgi:hypothetical protein
MAQKTMTYVVLILLLGAGFLMGGLFGGGLIGGYAAPSSHRAIVDRMKVIATEYSNLELTPKLADSGNRKWCEGVPSLSIFTVGKEYPETTWIWQRYGDTELAMTIWGPDESGTHYDLEFGRLGSCLKVTYDGVEKFTTGGHLGHMSEGFYCFTVTVE